MSVKFFPAIVDGNIVRPLLACACDAIAGPEILAARRCPACVATMALPNRDVLEVFDYLGLERRLAGDVGARELRARCEARLEVVPQTEYIRERARDLLVLAIAAAHNSIAWR